MSTHDEPARPCDAQIEPGAQIAAQHQPIERQEFEGSLIALESRLERALAILVQRIDSLEYNQERQVSDLEYDLNRVKDDVRSLEREARHGR